jgi:hypothetical protein
MCNEHIIDTSCSQLPTGKMEIHFRRDSELVKISIGTYNALEGTINVKLSILELSNVTNQENHIFTRSCSFQTLEYPAKLIGILTKEFIEAGNLSGKKASQIIVQLLQLESEPFSM